MGARIISWINSLYIQRLCRPKRIQNPSPRISNIIRSHYTDVKESNRHRQHHPRTHRNYPAQKIRHKVQQHLQTNEFRSFSHYYL